MGRFLRLLKMVRTGTPLLPGLVTQMVKPPLPTSATILQIPTPWFPGVQSDAGNTRTTDSDIRRNGQKNREGVGGRNRAVSRIRTLTVAEQLLTTAQAHARSGTSTTIGSTV